MENLLTREQYLDWVKHTKMTWERNLQSEWSQPVYRCECGGRVCKNLWNYRTLACDPPIVEYEYLCNKCGKTEWLDG